MRLKRMLSRRLNTFALSGAQLFTGAVEAHLDQVETALRPLGTDKPGIRIHGIEALKPMFASRGCIGSIAALVLGEAARPVRAILFNKSHGANWALGWHQDRTICVKEKREAFGFGPWTIKAGMLHVEPPFDLLAGMVIRARTAPPSGPGSLHSAANGQLERQVRLLC